MKSVILLGVYVTLGVAIVPANALADVTFDYEAGSPVALGRSIDLRLPTETKKTCLANTEFEWIEAGPTGQGGVSRVKVTGEYTDNYHELSTQLHVNGHYRSTLAANLGESEGKAELTYETLGKYSDLVFILIAKYEFGSRKLKSAALETKYQKLIDDGNFDDFIAQCGTHFANDEERWAYASVVVNISKIDESIKRRLTADYNSTTNIVDVGSLSTGLGVAAQYDTARRFGHATLEFQANGGDSTKAAALAGATQSNDISKALNAMQDYMTGISRDTAVPSRYTLVPFALFGLKLPADDGRVQFLDDAYFAAIRYQGKIGELSQRLTAAKLSLGDVSDLARVYRTEIAALQQQKGAIDSLVIACVKEGKCDRTALKNAAPEIVVNSSIAQRLQMRATCLYAKDSLDQIDLSLKGEIVDPRSVDEMVAYRIENANGGRRSRVNIAKTNLSADPDGRFAARLDILTRDMLPPAAKQSEISALRDQARATRYELDITMSDGQHQWYDLGTPSVRSDDCPILRVP